jgi:hypothetical protein
MISVGDYVYYDNMNGTIDTTIGIVIEIDSNEMIKVEWFDGFSDWYGPVGLIKV